MNTLYTEFLLIVTLQDWGNHSVQNVTPIEMWCQQLMQSGLNLLHTAIKFQSQDLDTVFSLICKLIISPARSFISAQQTCYRRQKSARVPIFPRLPHPTAGSDLVLARYGFVVQLVEVSFTLKVVSKEAAS